MIKNKIFKKYVDFCLKYGMRRTKVNYNYYNCL